MTTPIPANISKVTPKDWAFRLLAYALLSFFGFLMVFPFLYMMTTSLKTSTDVFRYPPQLLPYSQAQVEYNGAMVPLYQFEVDGIERTMVATGEKGVVGVFTNEALANADNPRNSQVVIEVPIEDATATGATVTVSDDAGNSADFEVYEVLVDGQPQQLLLMFSPQRDIFLDPDDPEVQVYGTARTAQREEYVEFQWVNYQAFTTLNLNRALVNTALVTIAVVVGQLITSIFGGYAFSRIPFRGRNTLFLAYLGSIMIPFVVLIIPMYRLMVILDWQNRLVALILPWIFTAYGTFLMRQFFISIPAEIEEAALIDGASRLRILWQIFVPLSMPSIATLAIFSFLYAWNSFLWPLLIINEANTANHVLTLALIQLSNIAADRPNLVLTGAAIAILPPMLVFILAQRYFIEGVTGSAVKG